MNERSRKEFPSPSRLEKRKGGVSPEAIARFVQAYLHSLPESKRKDPSAVPQGFRVWIQEVAEGEEFYKADLLEAVTLLAQWEGLKVGELLVEITGELKEDRRDSPLKHSKRARILESAYRVFSEKGFFQATVDEIAERAGVGKGTVYRHFESKENLFRAVVDEELKVIVGRIQEAFLEAEDVLQAIRRAVREYLEYFEEHKEFYRILVFEQESFGSEFRARYINEILKRIPMIRDKVLEAASRGRLKPLDDFYTVFYGIVGFTDGVILKWFQKGCQGSLTDELDTIIEVLFYGFVRNGAGRTLPEEKEGEGEPGRLLPFPDPDRSAHL
jgi:AcrR family transcriptional regulator